MCRTGTETCLPNVGLLIGRTVELLRTGKRERERETDSHKETPEKYRKSQTWQVRCFEFNFESDSKWLISRAVCLQRGKSDPFVSWRDVEAFLDLEDGSTEKERERSQPQSSTQRGSPWKLVNFGWLAG